ncbi:MAG: metallophosphoesterase [Planctomycetota bacterium]
MERTDFIKLPAAKKRIVVLGDPHGDLIGLIEVLDREDRPEVQIFSAGDNVGYSDGAMSSEMCRILMDRKIPSVTGNHEAWSPDGKLFLPAPGSGPNLTPEAHAWCQGLPIRIKIQAEAAPDVSMTLVHSLPEWGYVSADNARSFLALEAADVVFCGHTHRPGIYTVTEDRIDFAVGSLSVKNSPIRAALAPGKRFVVDAGSLARPNQGYKSQLEKGSYAAIDLEKRVVEVHGFSKKERLAALMQRIVEENTRKARDGGAPFDSSLAQDKPTA